jgi:hypothetical protein
MISAVRERCAGIDVHRDFVMVCVMWGPAEGEAHWEVRRFGTTVPQLEELKAWLMSQGCAEVVMESTGPYWEPVFNVLEEAVKTMSGERATSEKPTRAQNRQKGCLVAGAFISA